MGLVDIAKEALKEIPLSEVLRERISLALDRLAEAEEKIEALQTENGGLKAQLEREHIDHQQTKSELQRLKAEHVEEVRVAYGVEFRRGERTGGKWRPFCPKCHLPMGVIAWSAGVPYCNDETNCRWVSNVSAFEVLQEAKSLGLTF